MTDDRHFFLPWETLVVCAGDIGTEAARSNKECSDAMDPFMTGDVIIFWQLIERTVTDADRIREHDGAGGIGDGAGCGSVIGYRPGFWNGNSEVLSIVAAP